MTTKTIKERLVLALMSRGWTQDTTAKTRKYFVMKPPTGGQWPPAGRYFIGKSGALRFHSAGRSTGSVPHDQTKRRLLAEEPA